MKIVDQGRLALDPAIGEFTNLLGVKALPHLAVHVLVQRHDKDRVAHVDKRIAHVAVVLQVDWQIEKVIST